MLQILIVEDELSIAQSLALIMEAQGFNTHIIDHGDNVIGWVKENNPDAIVLDIMLPGINGIEICKLIREFSNVPIIMATAKFEESDRMAGLEAGANDYMTKPYRAKDLIARIRSLT